MIRITECPRDAMQGVLEFIPTQKKIEYIQSLLNVGFNILDFGSFVSPKAIPQLQDTSEVLEQINLENTNTKLLAIVASKTGAERAASFDKVTYLGYPFSFSPTFLQKNINSNIDKAVRTTEEFQNICIKNDKVLLQYISMAFGNPYGDKWSVDMLYDWVERFSSMGIKKITLSDITAEANPQMITDVYKTLINDFPDVDFGLHLHTSTTKWKPLVKAAYNAGCRNFDTVLNGMGGCPMSGKELLQNLNTYDLLSLLTEEKSKHNIDISLLNKSLGIAQRIFP